MLIAIFYPLFFFIIRHFIYWDLVSLIFHIVFRPYLIVNPGQLSVHKLSELA